MACFKPITGYRNGLGKITFHDKGDSEALSLPCGQCIQCRMDRSREWATRCVHEASLHDDNCFITLTYNDENCPLDGGLVKSDFQKFMKRLRKNTGKKIRYYYCGEYGDKNNRPHYHAILFGYNFPDWQYLFDSTGGTAIYTSKILEETWKKGFVTVGTVTFESAAYIARYVLKKQNGQLKEKINKETGLKNYERVHPYTGEIHEVLPEFTDMSRRPGIAHNWISRYSGDCYPKDFTTVRGVRVGLPRYYDEYLKNIDLDMYDDIKAARMLSAYKSDDNTEQRLSQKSKVKSAQIKQLIRSL